MGKQIVPYNKPFLTGNELRYIEEAHGNSVLSGDGEFSRKSQGLLSKMTGCSRVLLTNSCSSALDMSALLLGLSAGDEVILPSFTFSSTANAVVLRGATPVFVDVRTDTLNIDEELILPAITERTKAIFPVHYAGVACEMDTICAIASEKGLSVVEDAAQGVMASYKGRALGTLGDLGTYSFHETKNVISGEGGCLIVNDSKFEYAAEVIREKGTNRTSFFKGEVNKYVWQLPGSSYVLGELASAFLYAQLEKAAEITKQRLEVWERYNNLLEPLEDAGYLRRPVVPLECQHNAHLYYILLEEKLKTKHVLNNLKERGIGAISHYEPLHTSPAGIKYCRTHGSLRVTERVASCIIRLPLWIGLTEQVQAEVVDALKDLLTTKS